MFNGMTAENFLDRSLHFTHFSLASINLFHFIIRFPFSHFDYVINALFKVFFVLLSLLSALNRIKLLLISNAAVSGTFNWNRIGGNKI